VNDEKHDDDNPWDEDDGARTLATDGPSFEMPSNIPSPITAPPPPPAPPPPAIPAKHPPKATLVGLMPEDFLASIAKGTPPRPAAGPPRSQPRPVTIPDDALDDLPGQQDDGPTMLGAGSSPNIPLRDDTARPRGFAPEHRLNDADAETMALDFGDSRLPDLEGEGEPEEATRALTREEMMGTPSNHQDAHVIVGSDARGDEATLAIGPETMSPELENLGASLDPALAEALAQRVAEHHQQVQQQAYQQQQQQQQHAPPPPPHFPQASPQQQPYAPPNYAPQAPYPLPQPATQPVAYPPSGQHPVMGGTPPSHPMPWGGQAGFAPPSQPQPPMSMGAQQQAPWMQPAPSLSPLQQPPSAEGPSVFGVRITSQVMILAGVGVVCLAIFVVGLVLFFTTKF
jgi:hypothetical protein